jgi:hypothetical protein
LLIDVSLRCEELLMQISDLKRKSQRFKLDSTDILPLAFAGLAVGVLILSVSTLWLAVSFSRVAGQKPPTLVQQVNGRAFTVRATDYRHREPEVLRRTVSDWAVMTFTWGKPPGSSPTPTDEGKAIEGKRERIPTTAWEASFLLAPDFRDTFLRQLATDIVPQDVFKGQVAAVLVPQEVSPPEVAGEGRWRVDLIATRLVFDAVNPAGRTIPFNRTVFVRAIEPPQNPLAEQATEYQRVVYSMLERGVQIEEIRPLEREEMAK